MADKKITQLTALTQVDSADVFPIVDLTSYETKKITASDLFASPLAIGSVQPSSGEFTTLTFFAGGATVSEFSTDGTLGGDSDTAVPTEKAVKTYVDTAIGDITANKISQGDSSVEVLDTTAAPSSIVFTIDGTPQGYFDTDGLTLVYGVTVNDFSNDPLLADASQTALVTEYAVKQYVDNSVSSPNKIWQDDTYVQVVDDGTNAGYITFVADGTEVANLSEDTQRFGKSDTDHITITDGTATTEVGFVDAFKISEEGISLEFGVTVNDFSNDPLLTDASQTAVVTEYAVKQYVDSHASLSDRIVDGLAVAQVSDSTSESFFTVKVRDTYFGPDATTFTTVYYFDETASSNWINPQNMIDGNEGTFAKAGSVSGAYIQINSGNTSPISTTRNVEKVEIRVYGRDGAGPNISAFNIYPLFDGSTPGNSQNLRSLLGPVRSWTPWIDITQDPSAPSEWEWSDINNLGCKLEGIIGSPGGGVGDLLEVNKIEIQVTYTSSPAIVGSVEKLRVDETGISAQLGASVNEFSTDVTMIDNSNKALPTERAVKTYVDTQVQSIRNDLDLINIRHLSSDSTAVTGDVCLVNTSGGTVNIQMLEAPEGRVIIKKVSLDSNSVVVTSTPGSSIDGISSFSINVAYESITFLSDGSEFYII
jgi:hypothetical protein